MVAPSASGLPFLEQWGQALLLRLEAFLRQSEREVVLENVRDILDGFASNESCRSRLHVVEPDMLVEAARGGGLSKPPEIAWAGVVGRERHKRPVGVLERRVVHIPVANEPKVRRAGVDVRLHVAIDASDVERRRSGGRGEYLHDAHRTSGAAAGLIELG